MTTQPTWSAVDNDTASLLDLLAGTHPATPSEADEWQFFLDRLEHLALPVIGDVDPNRLREELRGHVKPNRVGAFTRRALCAGLVKYSGAYVVSTDTTSRNSSKPIRVLRWIGT